MNDNTNNDCSSTGSQTIGYVEPNYSNSSCPSCGFCKHCGRGGYVAYPMPYQVPYYPYYPYAHWPWWNDQPQITYTTTTTGSVVGDSGVTNSY